MTAINNSLGVWKAKVYTVLSPGATCICTEAVLSTPGQSISSSSCSYDAAYAVKPNSSDNFILVSTLANSRWEAKKHRR